MKRRRFLQSVAAAPIVPAALASQSSGGAAPQAQPSDQGQKIDYRAADAAGEMSRRFFNAQQFAALRRLSDILMPAIGDAPGALDASAPEFLDFLIGASPADRQQLYRAGLDALNTQSRRRFNKAFADVDPNQADELLAPLRAEWTYDPPVDPLARFLRAAKHDVRIATINSQEWSAAGGGSGARRAGGVGQYWYTIE